jgi:hypothetical protein
MLFNDYGILHRDISLNNLLLYRPKEDEIASGLVIDFDYSEELDLFDAHEEQATEECETRIDDSEATDVAKAVTGPREDETADGVLIDLHCEPPDAHAMEEECEEVEDAAGLSKTSGIRTVRSHFINCPWRLLTDTIIRGPRHLWQLKHFLKMTLPIFHATISSQFFMSSSTSVPSQTGLTVHDQIMRRLII